jgi:hypothetical protein
VSPLIVSVPEIVLAGVFNVTVMAPLITLAAAGAVGVGTSWARVKVAFFMKVAWVRVGEVTTALSSLPPRLQAPNKRRGARINNKFLKKRAGDKFFAPGTDPVIIGNPFLFMASPLLIPVDGAPSYHFFKGIWRLIFF